MQIDGYSLDAQKSRMKAYAEFNDFEIVGEYDGSRNAVVMTDMEGKELAIDCDKAEEQVEFDEPRDAGILPDLQERSLQVM